MSNKIWIFLEQYLTRKISVEFKCCISFFCILCFYFAYRLIIGTLSAGIFHMIQMAVLAYVFGWIQQLIGSDFEELDRLSTKEWMMILICALLYALASFWGNWFEENIVISAVFCLYMIGVYLSTFLLYKIKRAIDAKLLNEDLKIFKDRTAEEAE